MKTVLVAYATRRGSTREIAEHIAARLDREGLAGVARDVERDPRPDLFDAVVLGSAVKGAGLMPSAIDFARTHRHTLARRPCWLFSVGLQPTAAHHRWPYRRIIGRSRPREVAELRRALFAVDYEAFPGVVRRREVSGLQAFVLRLLGGRFGDFRDWGQIDRWTDGIAERLVVGTVTGGERRG